MSNPTGKQQSPESARKAERDERLAAQLRANLKRRKAAVRARESDVGQQHPDDGGESEQNPAANAARSGQKNEPV